MTEEQQIKLSEMGYSEGDVLEDDNGFFVWSGEDEDGKQVKIYLNE